MISDQIELRLEQIKESTRNLRIWWRPISDYLKYYSDNDQLVEKITFLKTSSGFTFYDDKSFFAKDCDSYLAILSYSAISTDEKKTDECELIAITHNKGDINMVPPYMDGGIEALRDAVMFYLNYMAGSNYLEFFEALDKFCR